jgi:TonB family protein
MRLCIVFLSLAVTALRCFAADPKPMPVKEALERHLLLYAIRPEYPYDMEHHVFTGKGTFELRFDYETGHLREIHIVKSTGSPMLDRSAIDSLKHWKAKPRALNAVLVPVDFVGRRAGPHEFDRNAHKP